jgi:hypothetical protein
MANVVRPERLTVARLNSTSHKVNPELIALKCIAKKQLAGAESNPMHDIGKAHNYVKGEHMKQTCSKS